MYAPSSALHTPSQTTTTPPPPSLIKVNKQAHHSARFAWVQPIVVSQRQGHLSRSCRSRLPPTSHLTPLLPSPPPPPLSFAQSLPFVLPSLPQVHVAQKTAGEDGHRTCDECTSLSSCQSTLKRTAPQSILTAKQISREYPSLWLLSVMSALLMGVPTKLAIATTL